MSARREAAHHEQQAAAEQQSPFGAMLSISQVVELSGLSRTTIWRRIRCGSIPPPLKLSANRVGWPDHIIYEWLDSLRPVSYAPLAESNGA